MIWLVLFLTVLLSQRNVKSFELNSIFGRTNCYNNKQLNCNEEFIDKYPEVSMSATNLSKADTYLNLWTRRNPQGEPEKLHKCGGRLPPNTQYDRSQELIVIVNPFIAGICDVAVYREWRIQILQRGNYNVLEVDWSWGNHIDYGIATRNTGIVAKQIVIVLNNIQEQVGNINVTVVGHSLGAQIAGLIGQGFHLKKIIALDAAGPGFDANKVPPDQRLDRGDADYVEAWFCNSGKCLPYLGTSYLIGHVHFYINGGQIQRSCHKYGFISLAKGDYIYGFGTLLLDNTCHHNQCAQYFKVSINPGDCKFVAVRCDSAIDFYAGKCKCGTDGHNCIIMGFDTEKYIEGEITSPQTYYLTTTDTCPYCDKNPFYLGNFTDPYA